MIERGGGTFPGEQGKQMNNNACTAERMHEELLIDNNNNNKDDNGDNNNNNNSNNARIFELEDHSPVFGTFEWYTHEQTCVWGMTKL